ncbi:MAG: hypothetical protein JO072_11400 [Parafilimonas sp.]|nr:hypothetical protein [Parafilimonas sp.]
MAKDDKRVYKSNGGNRFWSGLLLFAAGGLLMARKLGADIPDWLFSWYTLLIAVGLLISFKSGFRNAGGLIMIVVGVGFLLNDIIPDAHMQDFIWPGILMIAGIVFILRPSAHSQYKEDWKNYHKEKWERLNYKQDYNSSAEVKTEPQDESAEFIEINAVFGSINKLILSKNFKGGEINAFMGGSEINLLQADISQTIYLEINNVFGGTKLLLPGNWNVKNQITAVFGGVEDKRNASMATPDPNKTIILKGACVFGGIEIRNF